MNSEILVYILKRILLMIPTLLGVLTLTFAVVQFVPGGPVEQLMLELRGKGDAAVGGESSGEVEVFVFTVDGEMYVSLTSDHTDRKLEAHSVALSKQLCVKPVGTAAWRFADVAGHWDELVIRSYIEENGAEVLYQEGALSALRTPTDLIEGYLGGASVLPEGVAMSCGTVGAIGGIRPSTAFTMELFDPRSGRSLKHRYAIEVLPEVA